MEVQRISTTRTTSPLPTSLRVSTWSSFVGQQPIIKIVQTALQGAKTGQSSLGHMLLTGPSGHGKTTLARLVADDMQVRVHHITAYALTKPADIISLLNSLQTNDILFIDELHRCKPIIEEVLYVAMEDFALDMLLPDGKPLRIQLNPFTLIGATTKPEALSSPLKNRFVYKLHFSEYSAEEKTYLLGIQLHQLGIQTESSQLLTVMAEYTTAVPREIGNMSKQLLDRLLAHYGPEDLLITSSRREQFWQDFQLTEGGLTPLHQQYLALLHDTSNKPLGVKTIAMSLGVHEKTVEEDIEPLLLKLRLIDKTPKGRLLRDE